MNPRAKDFLSFCLWRALKRAPSLLSARMASNGAVIVNFHRVVDSSTVYLPKGPTVHMPVKVLVGILDGLARIFNVVSLDEIGDSLVSGAPLPARAVAITFDDGYEDTARLAWPVLRRLGLPATVFLATEFIGSTDLLWPDRIERALLETKLDTLELDGALAEQAGALVQLGTREEKISANYLLCRLGKSMNVIELRAFIEYLEDRLEIAGSGEFDVMMSWDQVREISGQGMEIGSHGISHQILTKMPAEDARYEISESKKIIEQQIDKRVAHFAYPNGGASDFSEELGRFATECGYRTVSSCIWGRNTPGVDHPSLLKRVGVGRTAESTLLGLLRVSAN